MKNSFKELDTGDLEELLENVVQKCIDICKEKGNNVAQTYGPASLNMSFMANDCAKAIKDYFKE